MVIVLDPTEFAKITHSDNGITMAGRMQEIPGAMTYQDPPQNKTARTRYADPGRQFNKLELQMAYEAADRCRTNTPDKQNDGCRTATSDRP